jgi:hypothetical protein
MVPTPGPVAPRSAHNLAQFPVARSCCTPGHCPIIPTTVIPAGRHPPHRGAHRLLAAATSKAAPARPPTSCSQQWATTSAVSSPGSDNCCACSWSDYGACWPVLPRSIRLLNGRLGSALPTITQSLERSLPSSAGSLRQRLSHIGLRNAKLPRYCGRLDACFEGGTHCIQLASAQ